MNEVLRNTILISRDKSGSKKDNVRAKNVNENVKNKKKKKTPTFLKNLVNYCWQYSDYSSIHGIKYLGERNRTIVEKLWWLLIFIASLYFSIDTIIKTYNKWQTSPVIVSFARSPTPIWQIPFPAVTICSETKTRQSVFNFTNVYQQVMNKSVTDEELSKLEKISLVCDNHLHTTGNDTIGYDTIDFLAEVSPPFDEFFYQCKWMNKIVNCKDLFKPMLTEEGICYTFNMLSREELFKPHVYHYKNYLRHDIRSTNWTLESGYPKDLGRDAFPRRAISAGQGAGLSLLLRAYEKDLEYICRGPVQGFKILLHHSVEMPRVSQQYFRAPLNQEVVVAIKPDMMTTSEGLRNYSPHKRHCYFPSERQLRFYKVYTQQNCDIECLANFTLQMCGCVAYHMPYFVNTKVCGSGKTICLHDALTSLLGREVTYSISDYEEAKGGCDCLPACTSLTYNSENSQADFNWPKVFQASKVEAKNMSGAKMTGVTFFFKEMQFITSERNELYGPTDFLASCGGLLGLFMGFSFLSIVEIIYFLSLRLICNIKHYGHRYWSGEFNEDTNSDHEN